MANSCVYTPSKGVSLYRSLTKTLGHNKGTEVFLRCISPRFVEDFRNSLRLDSEGVALLDSLLENKVARAFIGEENLIKFIEGELEKTVYENTPESMNDALNEADNFNRTSKFRKTYVVIPRILGDEIHLEVFTRTPETENELKDLLKGRDLKSTILPILSNIEISETALKKIANNLGLGATLYSDLSKVIDSIANTLRIFSGDNNADIGNIEKVISAIFNKNKLFIRSKRWLQSEEKGAEILNKFYETDEYNEEDMTEEDYDLATACTITQGNIYLDSIPPIIDRAFEAIHESMDNDISSELYRILEEINTRTEEFTEGIPETPEIEDITEYSSEELGKVESALEKLNTLITELKVKELKRLKIHNEASFKPAKELEQKTDTIEALTGYVNESINEVAPIFEKFTSIATKPANERCRLYKEIIDYAKSYGKVVSLLRDSLHGLSSELGVLLEDNEVIGLLSEAVDALDSIRSRLESSAYNEASKAFTEFISPFIGKNVRMSFSENGEEVSIDDIINKAGTDISIVSRWLDSAANSSDVLLQAAHLAIKREKDAVRLRVINLAHRARAIGIKAEKAGVNDFSFMYETDSDGNRTGKYIDQYDWIKYKKAKKEFFEGINEKYKNKRGKKAYKDKSREIKNWYNKNSTLKLGGRVPNLEYYSSEKFKSLTDAERTFYNEFMSIKRELDALLPDDATTETNAIRIRKDTFDRIKDVSDVMDVFDVVKEAVKDSLIERSDDDSFGNFGKTNLAGEEIKTPPIYFTKSRRGENLNDLTNDLIGALISYGYMANNYIGMHNICGALEIGRERARKRSKEVKRGNNPIVERVNGLGIKVDRLMTTKAGNIAELYDDMMDSQIYGIYLKDFGTIGTTPISKQKAVSVGLRIGSSIQLGLNFLAGIANATNGIIMQNTEAFAREFYTKETLAKADMFYAQNLPNLIGELGSRIKTNKLDLLYDFFNIKQEFDKNVKGENFNRKGFINRLFGPAILYIYQTAGDHFLYGRAGLAMLLEEKVLKDGQEMPLLEAIDYIPVDSNNPDAGLEISIEGIKTLDGRVFSQDMVSEITRKIEKVNSYCFGVYDNENVNAARRTMAGRAGLQYRDWMRPAYNRRFAKRYKDVLLDEEREGYYNTAWKFGVQTIKDLTKGKVAIMQNFRNLSDMEKSNLKRCLAEVGQFWSIVGTLALIDWDVEDEDKSLALSLLEYTLRRQVTEVGAVIPGPYMLTEAMKVLDSPAACISVIDNTINLIKLLYPPYYSDELESGPYKGHSTAYKTVMNSPLVLQYKNIRKTFAPEEGIPYLKQGQLIDL